MPQIDHNIDNALGLAVFYQYVRTAALNQQQQTQHVSVFSTELFGHYLHIRCQSVVKCRQFTQMPSADEVLRCKRYFCESSQMFVTDVIVFHPVSLRRAKYSANSAKPASSRERTKPVTSGQLDTSELVELLQKSAVEHLTMFRQREARDFGSMGYTIVVTEFEALYAYKRGEFQRCLLLSTQNLHSLIDGTVVRPSISHVFMYSEFNQLLDDHLLCLTGIMHLVDPSCRNHYGHALASQLILFMYLMTQCQMKLHHPVTSLARTFDYIEVARRNRDHRFTLDQLLLKLIERTVLR